MQTWLNTLIVRYFIKRTNFCIIFNQTLNSIGIIFLSLKKTFEYFAIEQNSLFFEWMFSFNIFYKLNFNLLIKFDIQKNMFDYVTKIKSNLKLI